MDPKGKEMVVNDK
jgi:hypothetical protein